MLTTDFFFRKSEIGFQISSPLTQSFLTVYNLYIICYEILRNAIGLVCIESPQLCFYQNPWRSTRPRSGSMQPRASRQCALHIRRPQPLRIRVELHPIVRHVAFRAANCISKTFCVVSAPKTANREGAGPPGWVAAVY